MNSKIIMKNLKGDCGKTVYNFLFNISIVCDSICQFQVVTRFFKCFYKPEKRFTLFSAVVSLRVFSIIF